MITFKPFAAIRPKKENVSKVASLPYDVMNREEAKKMAEGNSESFLHIVRSEIDLDDSVKEETTPVYEKARENFHLFCENKTLVSETSPAFYVYSQTFLSKTQTGIVGLCSAKEYSEGKIKKHENTLPKKEIDRINNFLYCGAHTEPVFFAHKPNKMLSEVVGEIVKSEPFFDFITQDGVASKLWIVKEASDIQAIEHAFASMDALYIADGHHRTQSSYRVYEMLKQKGEQTEESAYIMSVVFPEDELNILPYNRILKNISPYTPEQLLDLLSEDFVVKGLDIFAQPDSKHNYRLYINKRWYSLTAKENSFNDADEIKSLDVSILQDNVFDKLFGVADPRTDERLQFVGGIRGEEYLMDEVDKNPLSAAFVLYPVAFNDITKIADKGGVMPPKSTWFEPKLSSGLFIHKFK